MKQKTSKYKGVHLCRTKNRWIATFTINNHSKYLGQFRVEEDAFRAYREEVKKYLAL